MFIQNGRQMVDSHGERSSVDSALAEYIWVQMGPYVLCESWFNTLHHTVLVFPLHENISASVVELIVQSCYSFPVILNCTQPCNSEWRMSFLELLSWSHAVLLDHHVTKQTNHVGVYVHTMVDLE